MLRGWVYIITNRAMPDLIKIGFSTKDPVLRAQELNHTGTPHPYSVAYDALVFEPRALEQEMHEILSAKKEGKEWFRLTVSEAGRSIRVAAGERLLMERGSSMYPLSAIDADTELPRFDPCQFKGCEKESQHTLGEARYCLWHFREMRNPSQATAIRLLREEQERMARNA